MSTNTFPHPLLAIGALSFALACGGDQGSSGAGGAIVTGGVIQTGGTTASGGSSAGGVISTGGSTSGGTGDSSGGTLASGGATFTGDATAAGGAPRTGGRAATGGVTTGTSGSSSTSSGGTPATGGRGGTSATSGVGPTGGAVATGGRQATGGMSGNGGVTGAGGSTHSGKWQIMPLGDSITETTCYPKLLAQELIDKGHGNFTFVGTSLNNQSCGSAPDVQTEGHGCYLVTNLLKDVATVTGCNGTKGSLAELRAWAAQKPEVVLMEYGTNDAWSSIATTEILKAYSGVVDAFRAQNPSVIFFVAQITPLNPSGCSSCEANVETLNGQIPTWASGKSTTASPIHVVNVWASLPAATYTPNSTYTSDGCHPNAAGSQKMADAWYTGLVAQGIP